MADVQQHSLQTLDESGQSTNSKAPDSPTPPSDAQAQDVRQPIGKARAIAIFSNWITQGMNDSVPGALLPYIEAHYNISYAIAALVFVGNAIGFIAAAPFVQALDRKFGRSRVLFVVSMISAAAYAVIIAEPPFAVIPIMFVILGFNFSVNLGLNNSYVNSIQNSSFHMGIQQAGYGVGGTIAPLIGTAMASNGVRWSFFYFISLAICLNNAILLGWVFRGYKASYDTSLGTPTTSGRSSASASLLKRALKDRTTLLGALFIFAYQGAEVTLSGWVVSYLIDYRHGAPGRVGYVTAGFWAGITVGRFLLCPPIHKLGARFSVHALIVVWACLHVAIWLSKDVIGDAVTVAIIGLLTGPIAPVATSVLSKLLDPELQMIGISIGWSLGSGGAAVAPFITGVLAEKFGTIVLNPVAIILCVVMQGSWFGLPFSSQRKQQ